MVRVDDTVWCDGCGVEILGSPIVDGQRQYCCQDCSMGFECACSAWAEQEEDLRSSENPLAPRVGNDLV